ncbi:hypothetical protein LAJ19_04485 [Deinococcus taeanensis]|uniref:hypothetical protein n=1 Tax=Deinococcus taeanensis TaxID=2737050 RepID=UPI001CDD4D5E|nr:hypothetical protein [Deinococcus taeanensis]UBV43477.1 hypothetical protein LAJ19_04485 [Deinococcus taeanensis]
MLPTASGSPARVTAVGSPAGALALHEGASISGGCGPVGQDRHDVPGSGTNVNPRAVRRLPGHPVSSFAFGTVIKAVVISAVVSNGVAGLTE